MSLYLQMYVGEEQDAALELALTKSRALVERAGDMCGAGYGQAGLFV